MRVGILFPGQGTQHSGMGKYWYQHDRTVQECFEEASACLSFNVAKLCFSSASLELKKTINAQTSIFVVSSALFAVLKKHTGIEPVLFAGHSSGEYAAVHATQALSFPDALFLVHERAKLMETATQQYDGTMLAVLGLSRHEVRAVCASFDQPKTFTHVAAVAAHNGPNHVVVSCSKQLIKPLISALKASGGRAMQLPVAGGFHSRFMEMAEKELSYRFAQVSFRKPCAPIIANQTATLLYDASSIESELKTQICAPVEWWSSMRHFLSCDVIIQIGPGKAFSNILRRHWPEKRVFSFNDAADLDPIMHVVQTGRAVKEDIVWH